MTESVPKMTPRATILIVGYRAYDELERCLASVARFEPDTPVVLVDHAADADRGRRLAERYPNVTYVPDTGNPGFAAGVNAAARHAAPLSHLLVLNPDCVLTGAVTNELLTALDALTGAGIVGGVLHEASGRLQQSARRFPDITTAIAGRTAWLSRRLPGNPLSRRNLAARPVAPMSVDWVTGAFALIRRETFDALGGFDTGFFLYWEDADFCRRARDAGWTTWYVPTAVVVHGTACSSRFMPVRSLWAFHRSAWRYYWKHGSWLARAASPAVLLGLGGRFLLRLLRSRPPVAATPTPAGRAAASNARA